MRRNNWLALLLALVMVLTMVPTAAAAAYISEEDVSLGAYGTEPDVFVAPAVQANSSAVSVLQVSGRWPAATKTVSSTGDFPLTLRDGDIVELKGDLTVDFRAKTGQSPIAVAANAKAALIISGDVKLYGANASGTTGAAAAIHVPSSSALTIYSGNDKDWADPDHSGETLRLYSLAAYGGSAAQGGAGGKAKENVETTEYSNNVWESVYTWSTGGGGNGGGGAAAAIGGSGGSGGASEVSRKTKGSGDAEILKYTVNRHGLLGTVDFDKLLDDHHGYDGNSGSSGTSGESTGTIYIAGRLALTAAGGSAASGGAGGAGCKGYGDPRGSEADVMIGGNGGGGGGGGGCAAPAISAGGAECTDAEDANDKSSKGGAGGAGGSAGASGGAGKTGTSTGTQGHGINNGKYDAEPGTGGRGATGITGNAGGGGAGGADNHDSPAYNGGAGGAGGGRVSLTRWNTAGALIFSTANKLALTRSNMSIAFGDGSGYYAAGQEPADNRPNVIYDLRDCTVEFNETTYPGADGKATTSVKSITYTSFTDRDLGETIPYASNTLPVRAQVSGYDANDKRHCTSAIAYAVGTSDSVRASVTADGAVVGSGKGWFPIQKGTLYEVPVTVKGLTMGVARPGSEIQLSLYKVYATAADKHTDHYTAISSLCKTSDRTGIPSIKWELVEGSGTFTGSTTSRTAKFTPELTNSGQVKIRVTLSDMNDFADYSTMVTVIVAKPFVNGTVTPAQPHPRQPVQVTLDDAANVGAVTYQWRKGLLTLDGATTDTYIPTNADGRSGIRLNVIVTPTSDSLYITQTIWAANTVEDHSYDNGFCTVCGEYQEPAQDTDGAYLIDNGGKLFWFAAYVNGDDTHAEAAAEMHPSAKARLTADIDLQDPADKAAGRVTEWVPIGNTSGQSSRQFTGTFDGQGHTISGMSITTVDVRAGLFASVGTQSPKVNGVVRNFTVEGSITLTEGNSGTNSGIGGAVGCVFAGEVTGVTSRVQISISGAAKIKASITHGGTLCADGGTVIGVVEIRGSITGSEGTAGTTFAGAVNSSYGGGVIEKGQFTGEVENEGTISGGTFTGTVTNKVNGTIKDGTFKDKVENYGTIENGVFANAVENEGTISGGTFTGAVTNGGTITGGTFHGEVTCAGRVSNGNNGSLVGGTVSGGSFDKDKPIQVIYGTIIGPEYKWKEKEPSYGEQYRLTYQADGEAYAWQWLGDDFFPVMPQGPDKEGHTFLSWFYVGGKNDGEMVDEGDPPNENSTAVARYATGSGTEQDPCRIGSMEELLLFRLQVNRFGRTDLCAVLTNDIVINSGTFDADGRYTPTAGETVNDLYAIGSKERPYTGTFDGGGYTIRGLCCDNREGHTSLDPKAVYPAGLFGWLEGATVKNLTVTGYVGGRAYVGGIAGYADAGTTILNCRNECIVVSVDLFNREYGPARYAGGIVGYNEGSVTACYNAGTVTGIDSVGGITGGPAGAVSDCYNMGTVTGSSHVGGITGSGGTVSYCYNVGAVTGDSNVGGISGSGAQVNDCFFLGTQGRSAEEFADGTVLTELIAGRSQHPWGDVCCPPLKASSLAAQPVLRWQQQPLTMDTSDAAMKCGETQAARPVGGAFGTLTYTSSDPAIASVASGVITAHKAGTVTITAAASGTDGYYASSVSYQLTVSHSYTAQHDAGYHWQACACGDVTGRSAHSWVNGGCADCGYACGHADTELRNAKKASCTGDGYTGDTYCRDCGEKLRNGTVIKAAGHTGGTATCVSGALCTVCGQPYGQKDAGNHDLKRTAAKEPGVFVSGHIEYWQCSACGKYFADANGAKEISREDTIIPRERREKDAEPVKAPGTGDPGIALYGVTALLGLTGCAWLRRKKK